MAVVKHWYAKGGNILAFSDETYASLGGIASGWLRVSDQDEAIYNATYDQAAMSILDLYRVNFVRDLQCAIVANYDKALELSNRNLSLLAWVLSDNSSGKVGTGPNGTNPESVYLIQNGNFKDLTPGSSSGGGAVTSLVNNLLSNSATAALAAAQGPILVGLINGIKGGSNVTISSLVSQLNALSALITDTTPDANSLIDRINEVLGAFANAPEGTLIVDILSGKLDKSAGVNNMTTIATGTFLDGRIGKTLKDLIDALQTQLNGVIAAQFSLTNNLTNTVAGSGLDSTQGTLLKNLIDTLKGGSNTTIAQLVTQINTLNALVTDTTPDGDSFTDTLQEILSILSNYPEGASLADALFTKLDKAAGVNNLTTTAVGTYLDGRVGKTLKDLIDPLTSAFTTYLTTFNGANQLVKLNGTGQLPAVDASLLLNLPSSVGIIDLTQVGTVIDDGSGPYNGNAGVNSSKVFDGLTTTFYDALTNGAGAYVGRDFGANKTINQVTLLPRQDSTNALNLNTAQFQYSLDNATWTTVYTVSGVTSGNYTALITANFTPVLARYVRLYFPTASSHGNVAEMKLYYVPVATGSAAPVVETVTTASSITLANATTLLVLNPATSNTIPSLSVTLPANPVDGQPIRVVGGPAITNGTVIASLTITATQGIIQAPQFTPVDFQFGDQIAYVFYTATGKYQLL